jgi:pimeloyl-ACP methyl ester carboxylesterase
VTRFAYLHGFASGPSSEKAATFAAAFRAAGLDLLIPDLAAGDFENLTITGQLAVIENVCSGRPVRLIGSSMGGYLAALYAAHHPEVERLVLLAPAFDFLQRWPNLLGPEQFDDWKRTGYIEVFHYVEQRNARVSFRLYEDATGYEPYPDVRQPTLIFHGVRDDVVPVERSRTFSFSRSNVELELLDSDHDLLDVINTICERSLQFLT